MRSTPRSAAAARPIYLPDGSVPLHPPVLSEHAASLLPDGPRARRALDDRARRRRRGHRRRRAAGRRPRRRRGSTTRACRPPSTAAGHCTPRSPRCPSSGGCAARSPWPAARSSWSCPSRRSSPTGRAAGPCGCAPGSTSSRGTRRSRCSPARSAGELMLRGGIGVLRTLPAPDAGALAAFARTAAGLGFRTEPTVQAVAALLAGLPATTTRRCSRCAGRPRRCCAGPGTPRSTSSGASRCPTIRATAGIGAPVRARHRAAAAPRRPVRHRGVPRPPAGEELPGGSRDRPAGAARADGCVRLHGREGRPRLRRPHRGRAPGRADRRGRSR